MANIKKQIDRNAFEHLKIQILNVSGIDVSWRAGFHDLAEYIKKRSEENYPEKQYNGKVIQQKETISPDTLRRYWGVKDGDKDITPDVGKLSLIAQAIGFPNWEDFVYKYNNGIASIDNGNNKPIVFSNPKEISMCWDKGEIKYFGTYEKYIGLKAIDDFEFEVTKSFNTLMTEGEIIMLKDIEVEQDSRSAVPVIHLITFYDDEKDKTL